MEFYRSLPDDVFPNLKKFASKMASMYLTTYTCEQTFSKMKYVKSEHRTRLTDDHLKAILISLWLGAAPLSQTLMIL